MVKRDSERPDRLCELIFVRRPSHGSNGRQVEESQSTGKVSLGLSVIVRVTLRDGTFHEVYILSWLESEPC